MRHFDTRWAHHQSCLWTQWKMFCLTASRGRNREKRRGEIKKDSKLLSEVILWFYLSTSSTIIALNFPTSHYLYCAFTYIYSLLIDKDLCKSGNIKFPCALLVYLCLSFGDLFIFSVRVSPFYSYFCVICTSVLSFSMWSLYF